MKFPKIATFFALLDVLGVAKDLGNLPVTERHGPPRLQLLLN